MDQSEEGGVDYFFSLSQHRIMSLRNRKAARFRVLTQSSGILSRRHTKSVWFNPMTIFMRQCVSPYAAFGNPQAARLHIAVIFQKKKTNSTRYEDSTSSLNRLAIKANCRSCLQNSRRGMSKLR